MRDDDFWNRDHRHYRMRGQSFWHDHAEAMELLIQGNQILAEAIVDGLGRLWRRLRQRFVIEIHNTDHDRRLPYR